MRILIIGAGALLLAGCGGWPFRVNDKPIIQTERIETIVPVPCNVEMCKQPAYLENVPEGQILLEGNAALAEVKEYRACYARIKAQLEACRNVPATTTTTKGPANGSPK